MPQYSPRETEVGYLNLQGSLVTWPSSQKFPASYGSQTYMWACFWTLNPTHPNNKFQLHYNIIIPLFPVLRKWSLPYKLADKALHTWHLRPCVPFRNIFVRVCGVEGRTCRNKPLSVVQNCLLPTTLHIWRTIPPSVEGAPCHGDKVHDVTLEISNLFMTFGSSLQGPLPTQNNTIRKDEDKYQLLEWDSNLRSQWSRGQDPRLRPRTTVNTRKPRNYLQVQYCCQKGTAGSMATSHRRLTPHSRFLVGHNRVSGMNQGHSNQLKPDTRN